MASIGLRTPQSFISQSSPLTTVVPERFGLCDKMKHRLLVCEVMTSV